MYQHEHAAAIKAMRERETELGKATGTIFVKVLGIEGVQFPIPQEQTHFCITLDNGIDYIKTPYSVLKESARVDQEFSLWVFLFITSWRTSTDVGVEWNTPALSFLFPSISAAIPTSSNSSTRKTTHHGQLLRLHRPRPMEVTSVLFSDLLVNPKVLYRKVLRPKKT